MRRFFALCALVVTPSLATAEFSPLVDRSNFVEMVDGRELVNRLYGVNLMVGADGTIQGAAWGWDIVGRWDWQDGFFCREMKWGGDPIPYNCQLVEMRGDNEIRFTVDRGAGQSARFRLR